MPTTDPEGEELDSLYAWKTQHIQSTNELAAKFSKELAAAAGLMLTVAVAYVVQVPASPPLTMWQRAVAVFGIGLLVLVVVIEVLKARSDYAHFDRIARRMRAAGDDVKKLREASDDEGRSGSDGFEWVALSGLVVASMCCAVFVTLRLTATYDASRVAPVFSCDVRSLSENGNSDLEAIASGRTVESEDNRHFVSIVGCRPSGG